MTKEFKTDPALNKQVDKEFVEQVKYIEDQPKSEIDIKMKFNNNINGTFVQPSTMIRQVIRYNNQNYGLDENYYKMNMINNTVDIYGKYLVNQEIQYEIIFDIVLIQKK